MFKRATQHTITELRSEYLRQNTLIRRSRARLSLVRKMYSNWFMFDYVYIRANVDWLKLVHQCTSRMSNCFMSSDKKSIAVHVIGEDDGSRKLRFVVELNPASNGGLVMYSTSNSWTRENAVHSSDVWTFCEMVHSVRGVIHGVDATDIMSNYKRSMF